MNTKALTQPSNGTARRRPAVVKRRAPAKPVPSAYDDMTEEQLYALLDERLADLSRRVSERLVRAEEMLKHSV